MAASYLCDTNVISELMPPVGCPLGSAFLFLLGLCLRLVGFLDGIF